MTKGPSSHAWSTSTTLPTSLQSRSKARSIPTSSTCESTIGFTPSIQPWKSGLSSCVTTRSCTLLRASYNCQDRGNHCSRPQHSPLGSIRYGASTGRFVTARSGSLPGPEGRHSPSRCRKAPVNGVESSGNPGGVIQRRIDQQHSSVEFAAQYCFRLILCRPSGPDVGDWDPGSGGLRTPAKAVWALRARRLGGVTRDPGDRRPKGRNRCCWRGSRGSEARRAVTAPVNFNPQSPNAILESAYIAQTSALWAFCLPHAVLSAETG